MDIPTVYSVTIAGRRIDLPVVHLPGTPVHIALLDSLGDWQLSDFLAAQLIARAREMGVALDGVDAILSAGKAVTLAQCIARALNIPALAIAEKQPKSFWTDAYAVPSRSITGQQSEHLTIGGRRAEMIADANILVVDDVISTGGSIKALAAIAEHFGRVTAVMAACVEGDQGNVVSQIEGYPAATLCYLPIWIEKS